MGNKVSSASRESALTATIPVRKVCDQILEMMFKTINIKDFYLMSTKQECKRYVIFLGNKMEETFRSLRFAPTRGQAGMIFFKPIDLLQKPTPEEQAERQSLCLFLSYFFVRIFQIYGALAITLIDDANVFVKFRGEKGLTEEQKARPYRGDQKRYGTPGAPNPLPTQFGYLFGQATEPEEREGPIYPYRTSSNPLFQPPSEQRQPVDRRGDYDRRDYDRRDYDRRDYERRDYRPEYRSDYRRPEYLQGYARGGGYLAEDELGKFQFLKNKLDSEPIRRARISDSLDYTKDIGYPFKVSGLEGSFKLQTDEFRADKRTANKASLFIKISGDRRVTRFYEIRMEIIERRSGDTTLRINSVRYQSLLDEALAAQRIRIGGPRPSVHADLEGSKFREELSYLYGSDLGDVLIKQVGNDYKIETKNGLEDPITFLKSLKENIDVMLGLRKVSEYRDLTRRDNRIMGEVNEHMDIQNVLIYLQQKKPLAHCVARGLQLLGNKTTSGLLESAICQTKFLISKKDYEEKLTDRTDVPDPGGKLMDVGGIQALSNLFYDTIKFKSGNLMRSHKAMNDYINFMQKMTALFVTDEGKGSSFRKTYADISIKSEKAKEADLENPTTPKLEDITDEKMVKFCSALKEDDRNINPKTPAGKEVLRKVTQLFGRQIQHAANCGNLFRQLFTTVSINGVVSVRINKLVYMKGVLELNRINDLARNLLIQYYDSCESLYREGIGIMIKAKAPEAPKRDEKQDKQEQQGQQKPQTPGPPKPQEQQQLQEPQGQERAPPPRPPPRVGGATRKQKRVNA